MLVERIRRYFLELKQPRYRDRRGWYASGLMSDARDLYWQATGEPETNPTDLTGHLRMFVGKAIEEKLARDVLSQLHFFGLHAIGPAGAQIPIGGSGPAVDGYLDGLLVERVGEGFNKPYVLEVKVKTGFGANLFLRDCDPGQEYLSQIGYYLKDLNSKGITNRGLFLFCLISDSNFGTFVEIECEYSAERDEVKAFRAQVLDGDVKSLDFRLRLGPVLERIKTIEAAIRSKVLPPQEKTYKAALTPEFLADCSDRELKAAIDGSKVLGDWQVKYSRYKDKHLEAQGASLGYSDAERQLLVAEYKRRFPKSKVA